MIKFKVENNIELTMQDIMIFSFIPLMNSKSSKSEIILQSIEIAKNIKDKYIKDYALLVEHGKGNKDSYIC